MNYKKEFKMEEKTFKTKNKKEPPKKKFKLFGEFRWEKYFCWLGGGVFFIFAGANVSFISWPDSIQIGLLAFILGYLSEMRYRFFKDIRND